MTISFMKSRNSDAPPALLVHGRDFAGGHFESGKQGRCAIALVIMALAGQRPSVGQPQVSLRSLQRLDRGLFVDADDDRVLGRRYVEPDDFGGLGGKLGVVALAPRFASIEIDLLGAQKAPDLLHVHVAQFGGNQRSRPARESGRRRTFQDSQNASAGLGIIPRDRTRTRLVRQTGQALLRKPAAPKY
jgi:hypothetical protein